MDPFSMTANTVAVVGFAGQSCRLLYEFLRTVSDAPKEIQQHIATLKALSSTFAGIQTLGQHMPAELAWSSGFRARLSECMADFQATEIKMKKLNEHLEKGRLRRTWARVKWSSSDHDLRSFFTRVQAYHTTFSLDLLTLHIKMSLPRPAETSPDEGTQRGSPQLEELSSAGPVSVGNRSIDASTSKPSSMMAPRLSGPGSRADVKTVEPSEIEMIQLSGENARTLISHARLEMPCKPNDWCIQGSEEHTCHPSGDIELSPDHRGRACTPSSPTYTSSLIQFLQSQTEPVSIRSCTFRLWEAFSMKTHLWLGPVLIKRWNIEHEKPVFQAMAPGEGYGAALMMSSTFAKVTFAVYFVRKTRWLRGQSISVQWNLSFARQVRNDARIIQLARTGDISGMKWVFQKGKASPTDVTPHGKSLLHIAARLNNVEMVKFLIQEGADVNTPDEDGETPLHGAVTSAQDYNVSRVLIENGADLMYCNIDGRTPLHTFFNSVIGTIFQCHSSSIDEEVRDSRGMTLFHFVAWSSKSGSRICRDYVERCNGGLTGNVWSKDHSGRSVLHYAAERGNTAMIKYILGLPGKLDINCKDLDGRTPLSYAAETKRCEVIEMLKVRGGNLRGADCRGRTPLHHAARRGNLAAVEKLIALGGVEDVWLEDNDGATPLQLANQRGATSIVKCLEELQRAILKKDPALYNSQSRHLLRNGAKERDAQPHLQRPCISKVQGTGGILRSAFINSTFLGWGCSSLAGKFILIVFAALLWEWLKLSTRVIPL